MAVEVWANDGTATVTAGGGTAPSAGTVESWTLSAGSTLPAVSASATPPTCCYVADGASGAESEKVLVTNISGSGPYTATVTRGADGTSPVVHSAPFTVWSVLTRASYKGFQATAPFSGSAVSRVAAPSGGDDTAAFTTALAALPVTTIYATPPSGGSSAVFHYGTLALQSGTYQVGASFDIGNLGPLVSVIGPGRNACTVAYYGSGSGISVHNTVVPADDNFDDMSAWHGKIDGFLLDGTHAGPGAVGLDLGDTEGTTLGPDLMVQNFTGGQMQPTTLTLGTTAGSGGTFSAGTYYWVVTATGHGETGASNEVSASVGTSGTQHLTWTAVSGATGYSVYRGTFSAGESVLVASGISGTSYTDTGTAGTAQNPPWANCCGSIGLFLRNPSGAWAENLYGRVIVRNCDNLVVIGDPNSTAGAGTSFSRNDLTFTLYAYPNQQGVVLRGNGSFYNAGSLKIRGNFAMSSSPQTSACLSVDGNGSIRTQMVAGRLDIQVETDLSGSHGPQTIFLGNIYPGGNQIAAMGVLEFVGSWTPSNYSNSGRSSELFLFNGTVAGDVNLAAAGGGVAQQVLGALGYGVSAAGYSGSTLQLPMQGADIMTAVLGANTTVGFSENLGAAQRKTVTLSQPTAGGTYTYTVAWPSSGSPNLSSPTVNWAGGTAPLMPTGAGAWMKVRLDTADGITWYGEYMMSTGAVSDSLLVQVPSGYANGTFVGPGDSNQYSNFNLADGVYPLDAAGHYWAFSHRKSPAHNLYVFNYNGSTYTNVLLLNESGGVNTLHNQLDDGSGNVILAGNQMLAAGTTSLAPQTFQSGSLLTSAAAGAVEYDGTAWYFTAAASSRQVVQAEQFQCITGTYTLSNSTSAQQLFNATSTGALTVQGSTSYWFDCEFDITGLSSSSHTLSFGFALGSSASVTSVKYWADVLSPFTAGTFASWPTALFTSASAQTFVAAGTSTSAAARLRGIIRVNHAGTITPQVTQGTASAAAVVGANSWIRLTAVGSSTAASVGDWS